MVEKTSADWHARQTPEKIQEAIVAILDQTRNRIAMNAIGLQDRYHDIKFESGSPAAEAAEAAAAKFVKDSLGATIQSAVESVKISKVKLKNACREAVEQALTEMVRGAAVEAAIARYNQVKEEFGLGDLSLSRNDRGEYTDWEMRRVSQTAEEAFGEAFGNDEE